MKVKINIKILGYFIVILHGFILTFSVKWRILARGAGYIPVFWYPLQMKIEIMIDFYLKWQ